MSEFDISVSLLSVTGLCRLMVESGKRAARFSRIIPDHPDIFHRSSDFAGNIATDVVTGAFVVNNQIDTRLGNIAGIGNHHLGVTDIVQCMFDFPWGHDFAVQL